MNCGLLNAGYLAIPPVRKKTPQELFVWVRGHLNSGDGHWQHLVFSDESRFLLYRQDGLVRVHRQADEALLDECVLPRIQTGGGGVTIWGAFHSRG